MAYWTERKRIFGPDKWYLPMTQAGALRDDGVALRKGYIRIVHSKDNSGRPIMLGTPRYHTRDGYDTQSMVRFGLSTILNVEYTALSCDRNNAFGCY